jgi:hypothetical protein
METGRRGYRETRRQGDMETRRQGDKETGRQGDRETRRHGDRERRTRYNKDESVSCGNSQETFQDAASGYRPRRRMAGKWLSYVRKDRAVTHKTAPEYAPRGFSENSRHSTRQCNRAFPHRRRIERRVLQPTHSRM